MFANCYFIRLPQSINLEYLTQKQSMVKPRYSKHSRRETSHVPVHQVSGQTDEEHDNNKQLYSDHGLGNHSQPRSQNSQVRSYNALGLLPAIPTNTPFTILSDSQTPPDPNGSTQSSQPTQYSTTGYLIPIHQLTEEQKQHTQQPVQHANQSAQYGQQQVQYVEGQNQYMNQAPENPYFQHTQQTNLMIYHQGQYAYQALVNPYFQRHQQMNQMFYHQEQPTTLNQRSNRCQKCQNCQDCLHILETERGKSETQSTSVRSLASHLTDHKERSLRGDNFYLPCVQCTKAGKECNRQIPNCKNCSKSKDICSYNNLTKNQIDSIKAQKP